jgi:hypothetical protein
MQTAAKLPRGDIRLHEKDYRELAAASDHATVLPSSSGIVGSLLRRQRERDAPGEKNRFSVSLPLVRVDLVLQSIGPDETIDTEHLLGVRRWPTSMTFLSLTEDHRR